MIYFDNAATTLKKPNCVYNSLKKYLKGGYGNPGRSAHLPAIKAAEAVYDSREAIAKEFKVKNADNITFTLNATYAINIAIKSLVTEPCHVIISDFEHNSVFRPIYKLSETLGIEYSIYKSKADNVYHEIESLIRKDTKAIISSIMSNVDGREIPLKLLSSLSRKHNLVLIVDASQAAGHKKIDLEKHCCDAIAMPSHKGLYGIQGAGVCIFKNDKLLQTVIEGGSGFDSKNQNMPITLPERIEAGTLPTPAIMSLKAGLDFISKTSVEKISKLNELLLERLEDIDNITVVGGENGIISFTSKAYGAESLAKILAEKGICVRAGLHCAPLAHKALGTYESGTIRASLSYFNTEDEVDKFWAALKEISYP